MQIVIDIPEKLACEGFERSFTEEEKNILIKAIGNGTSLPKGHERKFEEIVVEYKPAELCIYPEYKGKPYYNIKYQENDKECVGFGTYNPEVLSQYIKEYFMSDIQPKTGHWILKRTFPTKLYDEYLNEYKCSECYREIRCTESQLVNYPYCHCGAKMTEGNEESEKINCKTTKCENCQNHNYCDYEPQEGGDQK